MFRHSEMHAFPEAEMQWPAREGTPAVGTSISQVWQVEMINAQFWKNSFSHGISGLAGSSQGEGLTRF